MPDSFYEQLHTDINAVVSLGRKQIESLARPEREEFPKMGFNAAAAVEPLDYDFTAYGGTSGTIPEPSQAAMRDYQRALIKIQKRVQDLQPENDEAYAKLTAEDLEQLNEAIGAVTDEIDVITAELCKNKPSAKEVGKLPYRVKMAFANWLQEQFSPEASKLVTKK